MSNNKNVVDLYTNKINMIPIKKENVHNQKNNNFYYSTDQNKYIPIQTNLNIIHSNTMNTSEKSENKLGYIYNSDTNKYDFKEVPKHMYIINKNTTEHFPLIQQSLLDINKQIIRICNVKTYLSKNEKDLIMENILDILDTLTKCTN